MRGESTPIWVPSQCLFKSRASIINAHQWENIFKVFVTFLQKIQNNPQLNHLSFLEVPFEKHSDT